MTDFAPTILGALTGTWLGEGAWVSYDFEADRHPAKALRVVRTHEAIACAAFGDLRAIERQPGPGRPAGLYYAHSATEATTGRPLFVEPGVWMAHEASADADIVRLARPPRGHGMVVAAGSATSIPGAPRIPCVSTRPIDLATGRPLTVESGSPSEVHEPAAELPGAAIEDPNALLRRRIEGEDIKATSILAVAGGPGTEQRLRDLPFSVVNPDALSLQAVFWIETLRGGDRGEERMQLQYSQTVVRSVDGVGWPSISVATLVRR